MSETIELVIRIPEDEYQNILHTGRASFCVVNVIEAGTVLPKGHGRLIDADALLKRHLSADYDCRITRNGIELAPTIIEAESEKP